MELNHAVVWHVLLPSVKQFADELLNFTDFSLKEVDAMIKFAEKTDCRYLFTTTRVSLTPLPGAAATKDDISPWQENAIRAMEDASI